MQSSSEQPLVGEERNVTTRITAAKETMWKGEPYHKYYYCLLHSGSIFMVVELSQMTKTHPDKYKNNSKGHLAD